jgi:hypothetical protein
MRTPNIIDDANNGRVHWHERFRQCQGSFARTRQVTEIARAGLGRVDGHQRVACRAALMVDGLHNEKFCPFETFVFAVGNDGTNDTTEIHSTSPYIKIGYSPSMDTTRMPARYKLRDGSLIDVSKMPRAEQLYVAWLAERLRGGAGYHELLVAVAAPGAYPLGGKPLADAAVQETPLFRVASDILARAAETAGVMAAELQAAQPGVYYSVTEAGKRLGISRAAIAQAIHEERLPAYRLG